MNIKPTDALIVVDVQRDFCPGGAMAVQEGELVVPVINKLIPKFDHVFFTQDWHPANHCSFAEEPEFQDQSWPPHCVQDTAGAELNPDLEVPADALIVKKGTTPDKDAYSGFDGTGLGEDLRTKQVTRLFVTGLATDYCVKATVLDGLANGFTVVLVQNACRGVDVPEGTAVEAVLEMQRAGALLCDSGDLV